MGFIAFIIAALASFFVIKDCERFNSYLIVCFFITYFCIRGAYDSKNFFPIILALIMLVSTYIPAKVNGKIAGIQETSSKLLMGAIPSVFTIVFILAAKPWKKGFSLDMILVLIPIVLFSMLIYFLIKTVVFDYFTIWIIYLFGKKTHYKNQKIEIERIVHPEKYRRLSYRYYIVWSKDGSRMKFQMNGDSVRKLVDPSIYDISKVEDKNPKHEEKVKIIMNHFVNMEVKKVPLIERKFIINIDKINKVNLKKND